jgi:hypothetical protein
MGTTPITFTMSIGIARRPEAIWPFLVDWEGLDRWMREARDFRVLGAQREGVGVEAETTVRIAGITTRDRIRVSRWEPPWILELQHFGWVQGTGYMELARAEKGAELFWREELIPPWGILGWIGMRAVSPLMRWVFRRDLRLLRELVETQT